MPPCASVAMDYLAESSRRGQVILHQEEPMRILMLAQNYPPIIGGEERYVRDLGIELVRRGHTVSVATLWQEGIPEYRLDQGVHVHAMHGSLQRVSALFSSERRFAPPFPDPETLLTLRRLIKEQRPDIVHAHNWIVHSFIPLKRWSKARLVMTLHDGSLVCAQKRFMNNKALCSGPELKKCVACAADFYGPAKGVPVALTNWLERSSELQNVDMFVPVSNAMVTANQLIWHHAPYRVVPNFIADDAATVHSNIDPYMAQLPTGDFLLFVGDIKLDKGVGVLLQAYAALQTSLPLVIIGRPDPTFSPPIPPNVHILQNWPHDAVMGAWGRCLFALVPSLFIDACPTVAMEAMVMGRPVVASRSGGLPEIVVDGETGLLVPSGDCQALQEAMARLLADGELRERMGEQARRRAAVFQAHTVVTRLEEVYHEVLQA